MTAIGWLAAGLLVGALYTPTSLDLWRVWNTEPNYSHGPVVALFSLAIAVWIFWQQSVSIPSEVDTREVRGALVRLCFGLALHGVALFTGNLLVDVIGLVFILFGSAMILGGAATRQAYGFPVLFLLFMAPLPVAWYQPVAVILQQVVSAISAYLLNLIGVPAYRMGYMIYLADLPLEVGEACSGLRQLTAILALSVAIGFLSQRGAWYRWTLALAAAPIAVLTNSLRVVLTGIICQCFGARWAQGVFHELEGIALVILSAGLVVILATVLGNWADRPRKPKQGAV